jgi:UDP-2,3-diacylglucosamine hydrolase
MKAIIIADAHLRGLEDPSQKTLEAFLDKLADDPPNKLIILGDLFDFWAGFNDVVYKEYAPTLLALLKLKEKGVKTIYFEGNHDFFMGSFFSDKLEADIYKKSAEITLNDKKLFLSHGDIVETNPRYVFWRAFLRSFIARAILALLGSRYSWQLAKKLSRESGRYHGERPDIEKLYAPFVREKIALGFDGVILAHSHKATMEDIESGGHKGQYLNPGAWAESRSYLVFESGQFKLERFSI